MIWKIKDEHWMDWLENLEEGVWTMNQMVSGPARWRAKQNAYITTQRPDNQKVTKEACTNAEKGQLLY